MLLLVILHTENWVFSVIFQIAGMCFLSQAGKEKPRDPTSSALTCYCTGKFKSALIEPSRGCSEPPSKQGRRKQKAASTKLLLLIPVNPHLPQLPLAACARSGHHPCHPCAAAENSSRKLPKNSLLMKRWPGGCPDGFQHSSGWMLLFPCLWGYFMSPSMPQHNPPQPERDESTWARTKGAWRCPGGAEPLLCPSKPSEQPLVCWKGWAGFYRSVPAASVGTHVQHSPGQSWFSGSGVIRGMLWWGLSCAWSLCFSFLASCAIFTRGKKVSEAAAYKHKHFCKSSSHFQDCINKRKEEAGKKPNINRSFTLTESLWTTFKELHYLFSHLILVFSEYLQRVPPRTKESTSPGPFSELLLGDNSPGSPVKKKLPNTTSYLHNQNFN